MRTPVDDLAVCAVCGGLSGTAPAHRGLIQRCYCDTRPAAGDWHGFDFPRHSELCGTCATSVIRSGSRWSALLCDECSAIARPLNDQAGFALVPVGRHTFHHRHALPGSGGNPNPVQLDNELGGLRAATDLLKRWRADQVASLIGPGAVKVPLADYLEIVGRGCPDRAALIDRFIARRQALPHR